MEEVGGSWMEEVGGSWMEEGQRTEEGGQPKKLLSPGNPMANHSWVPYSPTGPSTVLSAPPSAKVLNYRALQLDQYSTT